MIDKLLWSIWRVKTVPAEFKLEHPILHWKIVGNIEMEKGIKFGIDSLNAAKETNKTDWHIVCDLTESTENRGEAELRNIAMLISQHRSFLSGRMANIVSDPLIHGASRILGAFVEEFDVKMNIVKSKEEAVNWVLNPS